MALNKLWLDSTFPLVTTENVFFHPSIIRTTFLFSLKSLTLTRIPYHIVVKVRILVFYRAKYTETICQMPNKVEEMEEELKRK